MNVDEALKKVAVLGAAGKMGRGIALLLLQEMALLHAQVENKGIISLVLIDTNRAALSVLMDYLRTHLKRFAEKQMNRLRQLFREDIELVSNEQISQFFVDSTFSFVYAATRVEEAHDAHIIFEAVLEDIRLKSDIFQCLKQVNKARFYLFSNTSSLPIHVLNDAAQLENCIIGFHFYNPPPIQKLLELIPLKNIDKNFYQLAVELAQRLNKQIIVSKDVAGFIGNGFFMREILFACEKYRELCLSYPDYQAIYLINKVTQEFLVRPMGIFQLVDFVGIDVISHICSVMQTYLHHEFMDDLMETMKTLKVLGGQTAEGKQKNGFFQYEQNQMVAVYSLADQRYILLEEGRYKTADEALGALPFSYQPWKRVQKEKDRDFFFATYFKELFSISNMGAALSREFLQKDLHIAKQLVADQVAATMADVEKVLKEGFYHLYGPQEMLTYIA